jgi:hypothetical protein
MKGQAMNVQRIAASIGTLLYCCLGQVFLAGAATYTTSQFYDESTFATNQVDTDAFNNPSNATLVGAGQIISLATLTADVSAAFTNDLGGVINFDSVTSDPGGNTFTASYGASQANTLTASMTSFSGGAAPGNLQLVLNNTSAASAISGASGQVNHMGTGSGVTDYGLVFDLPLSEIGVTVLQRTASRTINVRVVLDDGSFVDFATESQVAWVPANGDPNDDTFFGAKAPLGRTISAIRFDFNSAHRIDDVAFVIAVPEPGSSIFMAMGSIGLAIVRRKAKQ